MERYETLFAQLKTRQEGAFVPFVTLGDPNPEQSLKIIDTLIEAGADAGAGDPVLRPAGGWPDHSGRHPARLCRGRNPAQCFEMLAAIRQKHPTIPIGLLMYANLVFSPGIDEFYAQCARVGVDSCWSPMCRWKSPRRSARRRCAIISRRFSSARRTPMTTAAPDCLLRPRLYLPAVARRRDRCGKPRRAAAAHLVEKLAEYNAAPPLQGFGICAGAGDRRD
jgi:tryptophan synthase alpha chain